MSESTSLHYNALHIRQPVIWECQKLEWESKTEAKKSYDASQKMLGDLKFIH